MNAYKFLFSFSLQRIGNTADIRYTGSIPGSGGSPGERHGKPLQYSCLENTMDRVWWAMVHAIAKS